MVLVSPDALVLFIDDGGVMNDNVPRAYEWRRLVAEFFAPRLGGEASIWREANRAVFGRLESYLIEGPKGEQDYLSWYDTYLLDWLRGMARFSGVACPTEDGACLELARKATAYITQRVKSAYPGAAAAVRSLRSAGFRLFTASGEHSAELHGYMKAMGIRECFDTLYGSDLINQGKYSVDYYRKLFEDARVSPADSLVVDDRPSYLRWAASLGAATALVGQQQNVGDDFDLRVNSLAELPSVLSKLA